MAGITFDMSGNFKQFHVLVKSFPGLALAFLSSVGKQGRLLLKGSFLSGQEIDLTKYPRDKKGKYTVSSGVISRKKVSIYSYPVNLFERGRTLRSGRKEPGKRIIRGKFKVVMNAKVQGFANRAYGRILARHMEKV